ncbi:MAG: translocation/assembly module TamB domain-containing protein [Rubrivivax sp.]
MQLEWQAPALSSLAPLLRLQPDLAAWQPRAGSAQGRLVVDGRWPELRSEGHAELQGLQLGKAEARQLHAKWLLDTASDQPLLLQLDGEGLAQGAQRAEQLHAELRGTWAQHRIEATLALAGQPPRALELALGLRTAAGVSAVLRGEGRWSGDGAGGGRWSGQVAELLLGAWAGAQRPPVTGPGSTWLRATELRTELRWDARDGPVEWTSGAGQVRLADAATLRWDEVRVDLRGSAPSFALRADVEPFELAPLLARAQPDLGWAGDLKLAARVDLRVGERVDADFLFERRSGDLRLSEEAGSVPFGLSDMRVAASAHDGRWQVDGTFAGNALGQASMRLALRPRPQQRWPDADTPIDGVIEAQVANLGIWGTWVPPGWRLSGELRTSARVTGRVGAPDYDGRISASDVAVRNLLMGVDLRQGEAQILLRGARAEIERLSLRGGDGTLRVSGHAELAGRPQAKLELAAERFRLLGRVDRQLIASAQLQLQLGLDQLRAEGRVHIDEGLFDLSRSDAPSLDDDVSIRQAVPRDEEAQNPPPQRARRNQQVAIELDLGNLLRVRGRGLDTTLGGQLRVGSAAGRLALNGIVNAAGGTYAAYGQKLEIERGLVLFSGVPDNPSLDVLALRPNLDVQVGVAITGTLDAPRVRLYSGSDMSESDKLSWLVLGRASEGLGRADTTLLQRAAVALMAGEGEAPTDALMRNLGLDQLSVRQSDTDVRETVVSLGKQLSRRWYVGYERGVNATAGTWQLIYRIAQRFTLRAQSGLENSLDLIWVWRLEDDPLVRSPVPKSSGSTPP